MAWRVALHEAFDPEFERLAGEVQDELLVHAELLAQFGPTLGRPRVDTLERQYERAPALMLQAASGVSLSLSTRRDGRCSS